MVCSVGDTARGRREPTEEACVNYWALNFRRKRIWLPRGDANTNSRMENSAGRGFSSLLTKRGNLEMRPSRMDVSPGGRRCRMARCGPAGMTRTPSISGSSGSFTPWRVLSATHRYPKKRFNSRAGLPGSASYPQFHFWALLALQPERSEAARILGRYENRPRACCEGPAAALPAFPLSAVGWSRAARTIAP